MKKNKDSLFKNLKIYNLVMTNIWQFLTIIAIVFWQDIYLKNMQQIKILTIWPFPLFSFPL